MRIAIIGGGATGFFTAINIAEKNKHADITIFEKSAKVLSKVKVSGGGRCNVTNAREQPSELTTFYPRGSKKLYKPFACFGTSEMRRWLLEHGVKTKTEEDLRVFPESNESKTIVDLFTQRAQVLGVKTHRGQLVSDIRSTPKGWLLLVNKEELVFDKVVVATGASEKSWSMLADVGLKLAPRVPSLFTFNIKDQRLKQLQGISFEESNVQVVKTKLKEAGPLLITHWGLSGPAILKLSAWGAQELARVDYQFDIIVNFINQTSDQFRNWLAMQITSSHKKQVGNLRIPGCPRRYFENLLQYLRISETTPLSELTKKDKNRLIEELIQSRFQVVGKSTFKEEFVTCGGVELSEVSLENMEAKRFPGLYMGGEALNIDALTGGFNFQACWTAGWLISEHLKNAK